MIKYLFFIWLLIYLMFIYIASCFDSTQKTTCVLDYSNINQKTVRVYSLCKWQNITNYDFKHIILDID